MLRLFNNPIEFLAVAIAFLIAITVHECSHAWMADRLGDPTARLMGRLTLNPLAHLDLIGTLMILFAPFGWAKPVEIDPFNLRNPRRDTAIIALSGPAANMVTAIVFAIIYAIVSRYLFLSNMVGYVIAIASVIIKLIVILNVNLAIFNLIPIHPLDGFGVVGGLLPEEKAIQWQQLKPYGILFLLFLVFPIFGGVSPLSQVMSPITSFILSLLFPGSVGI